MAKRYTDTEKWKKKFIKTLPAEYKLFWLFLLDECDHAGIWHVELDIAETRLGIKLSLEKIRGLFKERVVEFDGGTKWFIPDFIEFQYGDLNPANRTHKSVLDKLNKYQLKGLTSPLRGAMDKDMDKDMDMDKGGVGGISDIQIMATIEYCSITLNRDYTADRVKDLWRAFLIQNPQPYPSEGKRLSHFRDWIKFQPYEKGVVRSMKDIEADLERMKDIKIGDL